MSGADLVALVVAICLVPIGGVIACVDSALARVSRARAEEFLREGRRGAKALWAIMGDRPRYTNVLVLLRVSCELTPTVRLGPVARSESGPGCVAPLPPVPLFLVVPSALIGLRPRPR